MFAKIGCFVFLVVSGVGVMRSEDLFRGEWVNKSPVTNGIAAILVRASGTDLLAHVWGTCRPVNCDWGESELERQGSALHVTWWQGFATVTQTLTLVDDTTLRIDTFNHFTDYSGRKDFTQTDFDVRR
jgi:hypothetical protein